MESDDVDMESAEKAARRLLAQEPKTVEAIRGGGNNRLFKVVTATGAVALKSYKPADSDDWDRLAHEWTALVFLARHLPGSIPTPIAHDPTSGWAAFEWVDGVRIGERSKADIATALEFAGALRMLGGAATEERFTEAREACLCLTDLLSQIDWRLKRLEPVAAANAELGDFLDEVRAELASRRQDALRTLDPAARLPRTLQVLSPSDFGFHNALRRPSGKLVFLDFEYFGWDDPAKLACDVHWHPGMALDPAEQDLFASGFGLQAKDDPGYRQRITAYRPLIGLRWCLILLNEFLALGLARRRYAGQTEEASAAQARQLAKARVLYSSIAHRI
ncbi:MAG: phosphotransferase [Reyranella sp.]|nr:phosphotransferase [Reyranella sp.]